MALDNSDELEDYLYSLQAEGVTPVAVGVDAEKTPFLAYAYDPTGDSFAVGIVTDDPLSLLYRDAKACETCGASEHRDPQALVYPLAVLARGK
jgi:hypothetical protein